MAGYFFFYPLTCLYKSGWCSPPGAPACWGQQRSGCPVSPPPLAGDVLHIFTGTALKPRVAEAAHIFLEGILLSGCPEKQHSWFTQSCAWHTHLHPSAGASPLTCILQALPVNPAHLPCALRQQETSTMGGDRRFSRSSGDSFSYRGD